MLNSGGFLSAARKILFRSINTQSTVKFPLKALGLHNFMRDFRLAYSTNGGGGNLISGEGAYKWNKEMFWNDAIKCI